MTLKIKVNNEFNDYKHGLIGSTDNVCMVQLYTAWIYDTKYHRGRSAMNIMGIMHDYKHTNLPIRLIAGHRNVSPAFVLKVIAHFTVDKAREIAKIKRLLQEIEDA